MMGYDPAPREPLDLPAYYRNAKDNNIVCKVSLLYFCSLGHPSDIAGPRQSRLQDML